MCALCNAPAAIPALPTSTHVWISRTRGRLGGLSYRCPTEIIEFSDRVSEFQRLNTVVLGASVDSKFSHLAWTQRSRADGGIGSTNIPLIADITKEIARKYGVLLEDGDDAGVALRGLFIIDDKGTLRQVTINDLPVGRSVDEVLRLVQAFQYTDQNGEVCPAGWKPGDRTMVDDPSKSLEYFRSVHGDGSVGEPSRKRQREE